jgi:hypothetical protein
MTNIRTMGAGILFLLALNGSAVAGDDCGRLPTVAEFMTDKYDVLAVKKIQGCLRTAGLYMGRIDGAKSPTTKAALNKALAAANQPAPNRNLQKR